MLSRRHEYRDLGIENEWRELADEASYLYSRMPEPDDTDDSFDYAWRKQA